MSILNVDQISPIGSGSTITVTATETKTGAITIGTGSSIFSPAGNTLVLGTNNLERIRIKNDGKIGINTTNAVRNLEVFDATQATIAIKSSDTGQSSLWLSDSSDDNIGGIYYEHSNNNLVFRVNDGERLRIGSSGQMGLSGSNYGSAGQVLTSQGSGSAVQWATPSSGLSDFDTWYLTADTVGNTNPLQNNWSRWTSRGGTGTVTFAAPSSGIWTFPSTGYWLIEWHARFQVTNAEERGCNADIYVTEDNSNYYFVNQSSVNMIQNSLAVKGNAIATYIFDVTDVSTHKMKVACGYQMVSGTLTGHGAYLYSHIKFFKLRDT